jgi:6-phosphogluconolactonase
MAASVHVEVHDDRAALVERARTLVVDQIKTAIATRGACYIALAGGSTPKPLYEAIAQESLPWSNLHIFWGDERYVPIDHPDSNAGMAKTAWLDQVSCLLSRFTQFQRRPRHPKLRLNNINHPGNGDGSIPYF